METMWNGKGDGASGNDVSFAITGDHDNRPTDMTNCVATQRYRKTVRRLTPMECERLQGFPDNWTLIGEPEEVEVTDYAYTYDGNGDVADKKDIGKHKEIEYFYRDANGKKKRCANSARYKALGNSIALPFWDFLAGNITAQYDRPITIGSLFDGIGGFPYVFEKHNGKGTARWASEIEEFPIAVTKVRFPEQ